MDAIATLSAVSSFDTVSDDRSTSMGQITYGGQAGNDADARSSEQTPAYYLADAVITQAFRDLYNYASAKRKKQARLFESAKTFLLGATGEERKTREFFCSALGLEVAYVERMALAVIAEARENGTKGAAAKAFPLLDVA